MTTPAANLIADFRATADEIETLLAPGACAIVAAQNWSCSATIWVRGARQSG